MSTRYHLDVEFVDRHGQPHHDQYDLQADTIDAAKVEAGPLLAAVPECFYDRTVCLYANETRLVAEWVEPAVAQ